MTTTRNSKRSFPGNRLPRPAYVYAKEIRQNWLKIRSAKIFRINIGESKMVYRMTLGSIYYDGQIRKFPAKESETEIGKEAITFLKTEHPELWRKWLTIRNMTNMHLEYIEKLWKDRILDPVGKILLQLEQRFHMTKYRSMKDKENFYVEENIIEGVFLEIQHYASLGYRLDLFKIENEGKHIGNGYIFLKSSNKKILERFIDSINRIVTNENALDEFKAADVKKSEIEARV